MADQERFAAVAPRKGQTQLIRILELLARVQAGETRPLVEVVQQQAHLLSWGTTLILICGQADDTLFEEIFHCRRYGLNAMLVLAGRVRGAPAVKERCNQFKIPFHHFRNELDLDLWRQ